MVVQHRVRKRSQNFLGFERCRLTEEIHTDEMNRRRGGWKAGAGAGWVVPGLACTNDLQLRKSVLPIIDFASKL
jgi:hypothetical protein